MSPRGSFSPLHSGALSTNLHECALAARADGVEPLVVSRRGPHAPYDDVETVWVDYPEPRSRAATLAARLERRVTGWPHLGQRRYAARVARALRQNALQEVPWILSNDPDLAFWLRGQFPDARIVHRFHNQMSARPAVQQGLAAALSGCAAVSNFTRDWIENYYGFAPGAVQTVYNGVDAQMFHPGARPDASPDASPDEVPDASPDEVPFLNFVGRTGVEKGADILLDAALLLAREGNAPRFGVQIVGANHWEGTQLDAYQSELGARAAQLQACGIEVRQTGHVNRDQIAACFGRAQIHVVPSRWDEPFGLTTVEGMASGLATVASNTGGSPEIIADAGFLFAREDAADLADKLRPLLQNGELRRQYGARARQRALEFSWANTWQGLKKVAKL